jgi:AraC-like DNA-binding protein
MDFSEETLAIQLVTEDRHLLETLQPICDEAARERNTPLGTLRATVENEVQKLLLHGKASKQMVARTLGISEKALSRGLVDEGATYEKVVDQLRGSLAIQYIKEPRISLSQIAWLLGYEGLTSSTMRSCVGRADCRPRSATTLGHVRQCGVILGCS